MKGKRINSCQKGKREERAARDAWRRTGINARRGRQFSGSPDSPDIIVDAKVHVEVKGCENTDIYGWLAQAEKDAAGDISVVQHRKKRKPWVMILTFDNFIRLLKETKRVGNEPIIREQQRQRPPSEAGAPKENQKAADDDAGTAFPIRINPPGVV